MKQLTKLFINSLLAFALAACSILGEALQRPKSKSALSSPEPAKGIPSPTPIPSPTFTPQPEEAPLIGKGARQLMEGDWEAAQATFEEAYAQAVHPDEQSAALLGQGRTAFQRGDYGSALNILRSVTERFPDSPYKAHAWFFLGQTYEALQRYAEAIQAYQQYLTLRPGMIDSYVHELIANNYVSMNDWANALLAYQEAIKAERSGSTIALEVQLAKAYAHTSAHETAIVMYDDISQRSDQDYIKAQMLLLKGQSLLALERKDEAYAAFMDLVENYPQSYDAYTALVTLVNANVAVNELSRGIVDYYAGEYGAAFAALERYLVSGKGEANTNAAALYFRGLCFLARKEYQAAVKEFDRLIQTYPQSAYTDKAYEQKGYIQWNFLNQYPAAVDTFLSYTQKYPQEKRAAEFLFFAAQVAERSGNLEQSAKIYERITVEYPQWEKAFRAAFLSGIMRYRLLQAAQAQADWQRALGMTTSPEERVLIQFWMGKAQLVQGNETAARQYWQQVQEMDPTGYYGGRARQLLSGDYQLVQSPFTPPALYELADNDPKERSGAELWLKSTFNLPQDTDLSSLGPLLQDKRLWRGTECWALGFYTEANEEFNSLQKAIENEPANLYRLANYLYRLGAYRTVIFTARRILDLGGIPPESLLSAPRYFNRLRFGVYFKELFIEAGEKYQLHPLFLFSVARQESMFQIVSHSHAGARGIMQVIPSTGEHIAQQLGWPSNYQTEDLFRPKVSVIFGSYYLSKMREMFSGDLVAALAAYNGGPGNATQWKSLAPDDVDLFVESIRFEETRNYIRNVFENFMMYSLIYSREP